MTVLVRSDQSEIDWLCRGYARIVQNTRNLMQIYMGSIPYDRALGLPPNMIGQPLNKVQSLSLPAMAELLERNEPMVTVRSINFGESSEQGDIVVETVIDIG